MLTAATCFGLEQINSTNIILTRPGNSIESFILWGLLVKELVSKHNGYKQILFPIVLFIRYRII